MESMRAKRIFFPHPTAPLLSSQSKSCFSSKLIPRAAKGNPLEMTILLCGRVGTVEDGFFPSEDGSPAQFEERRQQDENFLGLVLIPSHPIRSPIFRETDRLLAALIHRISYYEEFRWFLPNNGNCVPNRRAIQYRIASSISFRSAQPEHLCGGWLVGGTTTCTLRWIVSDTDSGIGG